MRPAFYLLLLVLFTAPDSISQNITVTGTVFDKDSIAPMPFAYVVNKNSATGMVTDGEGRFSIRARSGDTLAFSYAGYSVRKLFTHQLKDSIRGSVLKVNICLQPKTTVLKPIVISAPGFSKEIKDTYARRIDEYKRGVSSPMASPISALYYTFSKKGKELQQLSLLYDQLLIDEIKEARLNPQMVRQITGNDTLDVQAFLNYCYLPDQFVVSASDYELFLSVRKYYIQYNEVQNPKLKTQSPK